MATLQSRKIKVLPQRRRDAEISRSDWSSDVALPISWFGEASMHVRSQALIAMRNGGGTIGMIALGSEDAQRFYAGMGTLYLERLGEMASAALARVLR